MCANKTDGAQELRQIAHVLRQVGSTLRDVASIRHDGELVRKFAADVDVVADGIDEAGRLRNIPKGAEEKP